MLIILLGLKNLRQILKHQSLKIMIGSELQSIRIFLVKRKGKREIFIIDSVLKTNPWTYKIKDLNGKKIIESLYEKEL